MTAQLGEAPPAGKRRRWLVGLVVAWIVVIVVVGSWSVWHSPATVPEQRDIAQAVPELQRAAGVVYAAADGDGRVVVLGELELIGDCRITPVRHGWMAARDLTVYVREGDAKGVLDAIAGGLPAAYQAGVGESRGGTRLGMHADAGNFIGIDTSAAATAKVLTLRLTSGCRPGPESTVNKADPAAGAVPGELVTVLSGLGAKDAKPEVRAVDCPDGGVAASYTVDVPPPSDLAARMGTLSAGAAIVRSDAAAWAYRKTGLSVVVVPDAEQLRVSLSTGCQ
ncbi:hypothetical protein [Paractinoplanes globisporus]|uniref:Uncharacterized protein n=1 Tax=Paractinoplanes globisporus TaxID=113565 RepID=A0ABW6WRD0_9ACTN|nr:hypothetical protein [Actinoplanes globisporus]